MSEHESHRYTSSSVKENTATSSNSSEEMEIDLSKAFHYAKEGFAKTWWGLLILVVVAAALTFLFSKALYKPEYEAKATVLITSENTTIVNDGSTGTTTTYAQATAKQLTSSFPYIINTSLFKNRVAELLDVDLKDCTLLSENIESTSIITLKVRDADSQKAYDVLNAVLQVYPDIAKNIVGDVDIQVILQASVGDKPVNAYSTIKMLLIGAAIGIVIYLAGLYIYAITRNKINSEKDIETKLNKKCLASIPVSNLSTRRHKKGIAVTMNDVSPMFQENIKLLATRLVHNSENEDKKIFLITSTFTSEGKSSVSLNVAASLALKGYSVLLVDADLRRQLIKEILGVEQETKGLINVIRDGVKVSDAIFKHDIDKLYIMCGDEKIQTPGKYLSGPVVSKLFNVLKQTFDYVIVDTAPCGIVSDTVTLCNNVDEIVYVIRKDGPSVNAIINAIQSTSYSKAEFLGCVLNFADDKSKSAYGYGYRRYGYGYGYGYGRKYSIDDE